MRQQSKMTQTVNGATATVTLKSSDIGWELRGWKHQIGDVKSMAEGDPYLHEMFTDNEQAVAAYREACHVAVDSPVVGARQPGPMVALASQERIDDAAKSERSEWERQRLDTVFGQLHDETRQ